MTTETLHALVRMSAGAPLEVAADVRAGLEAGGVLDPGEPAATNDPGPAGGWRTWEPLPPTALVCPVPAFVARIADGAVIVEGYDGVRHRLDGVDIDLLYVFAGPVPANTHDAALTVAAIVRALAAHARAGLSPGEAGARLRRIAAAGALLLVPGHDTPPPPPRTLRTVAAGMRRVLASVGGRRPARTPAAPGAADTSSAPASPGASPADGPDRPAPGGPVAGAGAAVRYLASPRPEGLRDGLVPVYAVFQPSSGPGLALGMLTAAARAHDGGVLSEWFEIRRPEDGASMLADLATRTGPAVLLCSNYVWSLEYNLDLARAAKAICPDLLVVHGGPSTPKYEGDAEQFLLTHGPVAHVLVRGEGEVVLGALLEALGPQLPGWDLDHLRSIAGLTFRDAAGEIVRTDEQSRIADLDALPSPYLTGEFDHLDPSAWVSCVTLETNRGCPYGCTFCDWGSATLSRIRNFAMDRVTAELEWAARRGIPSWLIADANFGIKPRDVEIAANIADLKRTYGCPQFLGFSVAKNTTTHLVEIVDCLVQARIAPECSLALQSSDPETLRVIRRQNIDVTQYVELAAAFRRRGLPLLADLIEGLPGQTVASFVGDLEFLIEHDISARVWATQLLPNSPMNDPKYRAEHRIEVNARSLVVSTATCSREDRLTLDRMKLAYTITEQFGTLRHVLRYLWWDHGVRPQALWQALVSEAQHRPDRYPVLCWTMRYFDLFSVPPMGWASFYAEVRALVAAEFGVHDSPALDAVLRLQQALMPEYGRDFPATVDLDHDYEAYHRDATDPLWRSGQAGRPPRPLAEYPPASFTVFGDPMHMCSGHMRPLPHARDGHDHGGLWLSGQLELDSPLVRPMPEIVAHGGFTGLAVRRPAGIDEWKPESGRRANRIQVRAAP